MKRSLKLIRKILEYAEAQTDGEYHDSPKCPGFQQEDVHYNIGLCGQAGYLEVHVVSGSEERHKRYALRHLTWNGHNALDELRNGEVQ